MPQLGSKDEISWQINFIKEKILRQATQEQTVDKFVCNFKRGRNQTGYYFFRKTKE